MPKDPPSATPSGEEKEETNSVLQLKLANARENEAIRNYLQKIPLVRVVVNGGRGLGNQAACVIAMNRLRELGYAGSFDVVHSGGYVAANLELLMPELTTADERVTFHEVDDDESCHDLKFAPLVLTGANDFSKKLRGKANVVYNGGAFLTLQPTDWPAARWWETVADAAALPLNARAALFCEQLPHMEAEAVAAAIQDEEWTEFHKKLAAKREEKAIEVQSVYGLYPAEIEDPYTGRMVDPGTAIKPLKELKALFAGLRKVQRELKKPIVVLIHSPIEKEDYQELLRYLNADKQAGKVMLADDYEDASAQLSELGPQNILVCSALDLPKNVFDSFLLNSSLPPVVEGCNSLSLLDARRSFLHGGAPKKTIDKLPAEYFTLRGLSPDLQDFHLQACAALEKGLDDDTSTAKLAQFILTCQRGEMDAYFKARQAYFREREDLVASALWQVSQRPLYQPETVVAFYLQQARALLAKASPDLNHLSLLLQRLASLPADKEELYPLCLAAIERCLADQRDEHAGLKAAKDINRLLPADQRRAELQEASPVEASSPNASPRSSSEASYGNLLSDNVMSIWENPPDNSASSEVKTVLLSGSKSASTITPFGWKSNKVN